jgi:hypothetical protein
MLSYQAEKWGDVQAELEAIMPSHYAELAEDKESMPLDIEHETYRTLDENQQLLLVTARDNGILVGYCITFVRRHMHYSSLCGFVDLYYLLPDYRMGLNGLRLFRVVLEKLKCLGVVKVYVSTKISLNRGKLFERLGFHATDIYYARVMS